MPDRVNGRMILRRRIVAVLSEAFGRLEIEVVGM
jgi:hypothetical protein